MGEHGSRPAHGVARRHRADGAGIETPEGRRPAWLAALEADGPTDVDAGAAEIVRALREACERDNPPRH